MSEGDWVGGDKVGGDKITGDKVGGDKIVAGAKVTPSAPSSSPSKKRKTGSAVAVVAGILGCVLSIVVFALLARHGTIRTAIAIPLIALGCALSIGISNMVAGHLRG